MNSLGSARKQAGRIREIDQARTVSVHAPVGSEIHCITGRVWLTQEGLHDDIVLDAGGKFEVRRKGVIVMNAVSGPALVYLPARTREGTDGAVIFTREFLNAAHARAAELRREALTHLAGVAWRFLVRLAQRVKAAWENERPATPEKARTKTAAAGLLPVGRRCEG